MTAPEFDRISLNVPSATDEQFDALRDLMPWAFLDGIFEPSTFLAGLGHQGDTSSEIYELSWAGKTEARRALQCKTVATLHPDLENSPGVFDESKDIFIEGDNLEVLKLLQRAYNDQVRLIYIDPPYNTTNDFVYNDDFTDSLGTYLEYSGQRDAEGKMISATTEASGRRHSGWLSAMHPRLFLARNLLRSDGVIFISIDDNEVHNLRHLMDEIFGQENFLACLIWDTGHSQQQGVFKKYHQYVLAYARDVRQVGVFRDPDGGEVLGGALKKISKANPASEFTFPAGVRCEAPDGTEFHGSWGDAEKTTLVRGKFRVRDGVTADEMTLSAGWTQKAQMTSLFAGEHPVMDTRGQEVLEFFFNSTGKLKYRKERAALTPATVQDWGTQGAASAALSELMGGEYFDRPKPVGMLRDLVAWTTDPGDLVLDFYAGSCTTAHAILELNLAGGDARRFIMVNLPEPTPNGSQAREVGYETVSEIGWARIIMAAEALGVEGFSMRCFDLEESNFKVWDSAQAPVDGDALGEQLGLFTDSLRSTATPDGIVAEVLLKEGVPLNMRWDRRIVAKQSVVISGTLAVCLATASSPELVAGLLDLDIDKVVVLDKAFEGRDTDKANLLIGAGKLGIQVRAV